MAAIFTDNGRKIAIARLLSNTLPTGTNPGANPPDHVGWGTGVAAGGSFTRTTNALSTESSEARVACTLSAITTSSTNDTLQAVGTLTAAAGKTITNAGLFDNVSGSGSGSFILVDGMSVALNTNDQIQFTFTWQLT